MRISSLQLFAIIWSKQLPLFNKWKNNLFYQQISINFRIFNKTKTIRYVFHKTKTQTEPNERVPTDHG